MLWISIFKVNFGLKIIQVSLTWPSHWSAQASESFRESILWDTWSRSRWSSSTFFINTFMWVFTIIHLKQTMFLGYTVLQLFCSVFTVCATCNVISTVKFVLYFYISTFRSVCSAQNGFFFLHFPNFVLSWYVALVLAEWFWNGSIHPYYYRYHFCFHIPRAILLLLLLLLLGSCAINCLSELSFRRLVLDVHLSN